jgi:electron transfer flavoprotein alpha subunit
MSVLIFLDQADGQIRKASLEAANYGAAIAAQMGTTAEAIVLGTVTEPLESLGKYGITKWMHKCIQKFWHKQPPHLAQL